MIVLRRMLVFLVALALLPNSAFGKSDVTLDVPAFYQADYTSTLFTFEGEDKSVQTSGCGAACTAMIVKYLYPDTEQTPETMFLWAYENGYYHGSGLGYEALEKMLEAQAVSTRWIGTYPKQLRQALKDGCPVIASMGPGYFTNNNHYIVVYGIDRKDNLRVIDPGNEKKSFKKYSMDSIFNEIGGSHAFLICGLPVPDTE